MNAATRRKLRAASLHGITIMLFGLSACNGMTVTPSTVTDPMVLASPALGNDICEACAQATAAVELTQQKYTADIQSASTAEIVRADAQSTLNSANATLSAAQTQQQGNADVVAAEIASTSQIVLANAQATLNSAASTQMAAQTQAQYDLQATMAVATQAAQSTLAQQGKNDIAAGTQTTIANTIATQTQSAAATAQSYADLTRQRDEQRQGPVTFLWVWCLPVFMLLLAGLIIWGFWRWLKIQQSNQAILENSQPPMSSAEIMDRLPHKALADVDGEVVENEYQLTTPDDQVPGWIDEVKSKLLRSDEEKDKDDNPDN